jgi:hypothetical protein
MRQVAVLYCIALSPVTTCRCFNYRVTKGSAAKSEKWSAARPVPMVLNSIVQPMVRPVPVYLKSTPVKVQDGPWVSKYDQRYSPERVIARIDPHARQVQIQYLLKPGVVCAPRPEFLKTGNSALKPSFVCPPGRS